MIRIATYEAYSHVMYGNSRYLTLLLKHLDRTDFQMELIFASEGPPADAGRANGASVTVLSPPPPLNRYSKQALTARNLPLSLLSMVRHWFQLRRLLKKIKPDVVYVTSLRSLLMIGPPARLLGIPVCLSVSVGYRHRLDFLSFVLATRVIFLSARLQRAFNGSAYVWLAGKFRVNAIGMELNEVAPADLRHILKLPGEARLVGSAGMLVPEKGMHELLEAARIVARANDNVQVVIIGAPPRPDSTYFSELRRMSTADGLAGRVHFMGWRDDAPALIAGVDVYCLPSHSEGVPRSILEAMWACVPVVATDAGATADLVTPVTGILVQTGDVQALATGIKRLLSDPGLGRSLGNAAHDRVLANHSVERHCRRLEEILKEVVRR